jgi:hypothetical protein
VSVLLPQFYYNSIIPSQQHLHCLYTQGDDNLKLRHATWRNIESDVLYSGWRFPIIRLQPDNQWVFLAQNETTNRYNGVLLLRK